ncbi:unnamed protein product, partial [Allacma fusca]
NCRNPIFINDVKPLLSFDKMNYFTRQTFAMNSKQHRFRGLHYLRSRKEKQFNAILCKRERGDGTKNNQHGKKCLKKTIVRQKLVD